jgi:hypothetical protein
VNEAQLVAAMQRKVEEELGDLVTWREGRWEFIDGPVAMLKLVPLRLEIAEALRPRAEKHVPDEPADVAAPPAAGAPTPASVAPMPIAGPPSITEPEASHEVTASAVPESTAPEPQGAAAARESAGPPPPAAVEERDLDVPAPPPKSSHSADAVDASAEIEASPPSAARLADGEALVASRNARKYHRRSCSKAKKIGKASRLTFANEAEAVARGLEACLHCLGETAKA